MLRLFRSNQPLIFFLVPLLALILWSGSLLHPTAPATVSGSMPLYDLLLRFTGSSGWVQVSVSLLLTLLVAYMTGQLNNRYIFIQERSQMPVLFVILVAGLFPENNTLHPVQCALPFFLLALGKIISTYRVENLSYHPFEASFFIGVAGLFYGPALLFLPVLWIGLSLFRPGLWREWFFTIAGLLVPYIFWFTWLLITKQEHGDFVNRFIHSFQKDTQLMLTPKAWAVLGFLLFLLLLSSMKMVEKFQTKKIIARRSFTLFLWMFLFWTAVFFLLPSAGTDILLVLSIPLSYLFSHYFTYIRKKWWGELLLWIVAGLLVYSLVLD